MKHPPHDMLMDEMEPAWEIAYLFPPQGQWTECEYLALNTNRLVELSNGRLEVLSMPTISHQDFIAYLYTLLLTFVTEHDLGKVMFNGVRVRLWPGQFREPDVAFMLKAHAARMGKKFWNGADLVMEVVSEGAEDRKRDLVDKRREYAQAGFPEYWIVDPHEERITILRLARKRYVVHGEFSREETASSVLLPGFTVDVGEAFAAASPKTVRKIEEPPNGAPAKEKEGTMKHPTEDATTKEMEPAWEIAYLFPPQGQWTEDEYLALETNWLVELSDGSLEVLPVATTSHQSLVLYLCNLLLAHTAPGNLGTVLIAPLSVQLWRGQFREPDVVFMLNEHKKRIGERYWKGADLVMEVVSGGREDRNRDLVTKRREYARGRIPEYWIVDPQEQTITVLRLARKRYVVHGGFGHGETATSALLPGFTVDVGEAFARCLPADNKEE